MNFKLLVDTLTTGTPIAVLVALVGVIWQAIHEYSRNKFNDENTLRKQDLAQRKFKYQKELEELQFEYATRR
jgi:hypothetical protein